MTEKLKTLMDRTADVDFDAVDLAAVVGAGERAVRRRRTGLAAGAVAAVLVAGGLAAVLGEADTATEEPPVVDAPRSELAWVVGDILHTPAGSQDLGRRATAFVRTTAGIAFVDDRGTVFSVLGGEVRELGSGLTGEGQLAADENGTWVGWVDRSGARPVFVSADLTTGRVVEHDEHTDGMTGEPPRLAWYFAIDGGTAYWLDSRGVVATDLASDEARVLARPAQARWTGDVTAGLMVRLVEGDGGSDLGSELLDTDLAVVLPGVDDRYFGVVSPDGRWVTSLASPSVVEVRTGRELPLDHRGPSDTVPYEWLDADTVAVLSERAEDDGHGALDLLTCEVPSGQCTIVEEGLPADVVLPRGHS